MIYNLYTSLYKSSLSYTTVFQVIWYGSHTRLGHLKGKGLSREKIVQRLKLGPAENHIVIAWPERIILSPPLTGGLSFISFVLGGI